MGKKLTTKEAFLELLNDDELYKTLPGSKQAKFRVYRQRMNQGKLENDTMERALKEFGYTVIQERLWVRD